MPEHQSTPQRSGLTAAQHHALRHPYAAADAPPAELRQLVRLGLLEKVCGDYFTTAEGKRVREMPHV